VKRKQSKFARVTVSSTPMVELKFMPLVTLSYESTLELKPIPVTVSTENAGEAGEGAVKRMTKAVRTARAKKAVAASAKVRSRKVKAKAKRKVKKAASATQASPRTRRKG
jgi:hypothetical protein